MSHVTQGELRVNDLDALDEAAQELGLVLHRGKTTWNWYGTWVNDFSGERAAASTGFDPKLFGKGLHALSIKGAHERAYEIGIVPARDGDGMEVLYDAWGAGGREIEKVAGSQLEKLKHAYAAAVAVKRARAKFVPKGWQLKKMPQPGGRTLVRLMKG